MSDRDQRLILAVDYRTGVGPVLTLYSRVDEEIASCTISIDALPDEYTEQDLHDAWIKSPLRTDGENKPSDQLETATAGRDDWSESTPADAGETLFGGGSDMPEFESQEGIRRYIASRIQLERMLSRSNEQDATVRLSFKEGYGYSARHVPSGVASQGETEPEALRGLAEALELHRRDDIDERDLAAELEELEDEIADMPDLGRQDLPDRDEKE